MTKIKPIGRLQVSPLAKALGGMLIKIMEVAAQKKPPTKKVTAVKVVPKKPDVKAKIVPVKPKPIAPVQAHKKAPIVSRPQKKNRVIVKRVYNRVELQDATAEAIIFPDVEDVTKVSKGDKAEINGEPAKGDYVMPDGKIFRFVDGRLSKIIPATEEALAQMKAYLDSKKLKPNPTATPEDRFTGILDRYKEDRRRKQIEDYKRKNKK